MIFDPPDWATYELVLMRVGFAALVLWRLPRRPPGGTVSNPVGLSRLVNLDPLLRPRGYRVVQAVAIAAALLYAVGVAAPVGIGVLAGVWLLVMTAVSSRGWVNHGDHLALAAAVAQFGGGLAYRITDWGDWSGNDVVLDGVHGTAVWWAVQAMMAVYFVSGISKLARTGFTWVGDAHQLAITVVARAETGLQDHPARQPARDRAVHIADWLSRHRTLSMVLFGGGLWLELAAPFALVNRATLVGFGLAYIALHRVIGVFLLLRFRYYQWTLLIFCVNVPYLVVEPWV